MMMTIGRENAAAMGPKTPASGARADGGNGDDAQEEYPGVPGVPRAEVDAFLEDLDSFQPIVRAMRCNAMRCDGMRRDAMGVMSFAFSRCVCVCVVRTDKRGVCCRRSSSNRFQTS